MKAFAIAIIPLALAACGAAEPPVQSASASTPTLFRGAQREVRLRCGSETLRARLRQGQILAQIGSGASTVLVPVDDPRASSGPAYGDGRLTLYKAPGAQSWMLATNQAGASPCTPATGG
jgi:hypothetical protein